MKKGPKKLFIAQINGFFEFRIEYHFD